MVLVNDEIQGVQLIVFVVVNQKNVVKKVIFKLDKLYKNENDRNLEIYLFKLKKYKVIKSLIF